MTTARDTSIATITQKRTGSAPASAPRSTVSPTSRKISALATAATAQYESGGFVRRGRPKQYGTTQSPRSRISWAVCTTKTS